MWADDNTDFTSKISLFRAARRNNELKEDIRDFGDLMEIFHTYAWQIVPDKMNDIKNYFQQKGFQEVSSLQEFQEASQDIHVYFGKGENLQFLQLQEE